MCNQGLIENREQSQLRHGYLENSNALHDTMLW